MNGKVNSIDSIRHSFFTMIISAFLLGIGGASCAALPQVTPSASEDDADNIVDIVNDIVVGSPVEESDSDAAIENSPIQVDVLEFAGNGDTFLEAIDTAIGELGMPVEHLYVEVIDAADHTWQGEQLRYTDRMVTFLQQAESGANSGLRITGQFDAVQIGDELASTARNNMSHGAVDVEIQFVRARLGSDNRWSFDVTVAHPDTGWEDYVDGWHIESADGAILGTRILLHPHVSEQPFTRSLSSVFVDGEVVWIRGHDLVSGYSSEAVEIPLAAAVRTDAYEVVR